MISNIGALWGNSSNRGAVRRVRPRCSKQGRGWQSQKMEVMEKQREQELKRVCSGFVGKASS